MPIVFSEILMHPGDLISTSLLLSQIFLGQEEGKKKKKLEASSCSEVTKIIYSINLMSSKLIYFPSDVLGV